MCHHYSRAAPAAKAGIGPVASPRPFVDGVHNACQCRIGLPHEQHDAGEQTPQDAHAENSATVPNGGADTPASLSEAAQMSEGVAAVDDPATEALSA